MNYDYVRFYSTFYFLTKLEKNDELNFGAILFYIIAHECETSISNDDNDTIHNAPNSDDDCFITTHRWRNTRAPKVK